MNGEDGNTYDDEFHMIERLLVMWSSIGTRNKRERV